MKLVHYFSALFLLFSVGNLHAQQQYTVNGKVYTLKSEVEGPLTLLWNTIDGEYRYFLKKDDEIKELKNTKQNGKYQEEFKETLEHQTSDAPVSTEKTILTLPSLHSFFAAYNKKQDPNFFDEEKSIALQFRLGAFVGITNSVFTENIYNNTQALAGIDLEMIDNVKLKRHSMVLRLKQTVGSNSYKHSTTQLSLNYRFKFVKTSKFDAFINCKFAALTYFKTEEITEHELAMSKTRTTSGTDFSAPITFGIGADYKIGNGYITFNYNDIVGLTVESNDEFPIDFTLGYKFNL